MKKRIITQKEFEERIDTMLAEVYGASISIYCVPASGLPVGYLLKARSTKRITIMPQPDKADYIIDDLIDSGNTKKRYRKAYPGKPFLVALNKPLENITDWIVWPWQNTAESSAPESSAEDIPLRLLQFIGEDPTREGLQDTPKRFLKAWEHYSGGYKENAAGILKVFEDGAQEYNELVLVKNIPVYSHCEHHLAPFYGVAHIGYIPNGKIVGLSKLPRLVNMFMRRLQVQERLTVQIATSILSELEPLGVAVVLQCEHSCMIARGVQVTGSKTVTSAMLGIFKDDIKARSEFLKLVQHE